MKSIKIRKTSTSTSTRVEKTIPKIFSISNDLFLHIIDYIDLHYILKILWKICQKWYIIMKKNNHFWFNHYKKFIGHVGGVPNVTYEYFKSQFVKKRKLFYELIKELKNVNYYNSTLNSKETKKKINEIFEKYDKNRFFYDCEYINFIDFLQISRLLKKRGLKEKKDEFVLSLLKKYSMNNESVFYSIIDGSDKLCVLMKNIGDMKKSIKRKIIGEYLYWLEYFIHHYYNNELFERKDWVKFPYNDLFEKKSDTSNRFHYFNYKTSDNIVKDLNVILCQQKLETDRKKFNELIIKGIYVAAKIVDNNTSTPESFINWNGFFECLEYFGEECGENLLKIYRYNVSDVKELVRFYLFVNSKQTFLPHLNINELLIIDNPVKLKFIRSFFDFLFIVKSILSPNNKVYLLRIYEIIMKDRIGFSILVFVKLLIKDYFINVNSELFQSIIDVNFEYDFFLNFSKIITPEIKKRFRYNYDYILQFLIEINRMDLVERFLKYVLNRLNNFLYYKLLNSRFIVCEFILFLRRVRSRCLKKTEKGGVYHKYFPHLLKGFLAILNDIIFNVSDMVVIIKYLQSMKSPDDFTSKLILKLLKYNFSLRFVNQQDIIQYYIFKNKVEFQRVYEYFYKLNYTILTDLLETILNEEPKRESLKTILKQENDYSEVVAFIKMVKDKQK